MNEEWGVKVEVRDSREDAKGFMAVSFHRFKGCTFGVLDGALLIYGKAADECCPPPALAAFGPGMWRSARLVNESEM